MYANDNDLDQALFDAVNAEELETIQSLLYNGARFSYTGDNQNNALHCAVLKDNVDIIAMLITFGADLHLKNKDGFTPRTLASSLKHWDSLKALTLSGIQHAVLRNDLKGLEFNLKNGADLTQKNEKGKTPIQLAAEKKQWKCVKTIANSKKEEENAHDSNYGSALLAAVKANKLDVAKTLLKAGAELTWHTVSDKNHLLHHAVLNNNPEMISLLLENGANLTLKNKEGLTPIQLAAENKHWKCVETIANSKKEADNAHDSNYGSALLAAVEANELNIAKTLLKAGAQLSWYYSTDKNRLLHHAVLNKNPEMISLLLEYGADLIKNKDGRTPIQLAEHLKYRECIAAFSGNNKTNPGKETLPLNEPKWILNQPNTAALILELLLQNQMPENSLIALAKTRGIKEKVFKHIETYSPGNQQAIIDQVIDETTPLGRFFRIQRGFFKTSASKGMLAKCLRRGEELSKMGVQSAELCFQEVAADSDRVFIEIPSVSLDQSAMDTVISPEAEDAEDIELSKLVDDCSGPSVSEYEGLKTSKSEDDSFSEMPEGAVEETQLSPAVSFEKATKPEEVQTPVDNPTIPVRITQFPYLRSIIDGTPIPVSKNSPDTPAPHSKADLSGLSNDNESTAPDTSRISNDVSTSDHVTLSMAAPDPALWSLIDGTPIPVTKNSPDALTAGEIDSEADLIDLSGDNESTAADTSRTSNDVSPSDHVTLSMFPAVPRDNLALAEKEKRPAQTRMAMLA